MTLLHHMALSVVSLMCFSQSSNAETHRLVVDLINLTSTVGEIKVGLHNKSETFPSDWESVYRQQQIPAAARELLVEFNNLPTGTYAVVAIHDENTNGEMDKNFIGFPREGFGTSNNPTFFGPPRFSSAAFELIEDAKMKIEMVYF